MKVYIPANQRQAYTAREGAAAWAAADPQAQRHALALLTWLTFRRSPRALWRAPGNPAYKAGLVLLGALIKLGIVCA